jgi:iron complex transport system ATP-binding protein
MDTRTLLPALSVENASFSYSDTPVLFSISFAFLQGEFVGIIGPNGSGKSTLLRLIAGITHPTSGTIRLNGTSLGELSRREIARRVAVVPQETTFVFPFSVLEVVLMGRSPHLGRFGLESAADLDIARSAMEATDTWFLRDRTMEEVSGGEKQRIIVARALAQQPAILLLDEPTNALDIRHQVDIYQLLQRLHDESGLTIVLVSHDLNLSARACERLILLHNGRVCRDGNPEEVMESSLLSEVYGTDLDVHTDPTTSAPIITTPIDRVVKRRRTED